MAQRVALANLPNFDADGHAHVDSCGADVKGSAVFGVRLWVLVLLSGILQLVIPLQADAVPQWRARVAQDRRAGFCDVPGTFSTKEEAVAAMRASSCLPAAFASVLKESTASSLSAKEVTYTYSAPDISATVTPWTCYNFIGDNGSSGLSQPCTGDGATYAPDEATAVAYYTVSDGCSLDPFRASQTVGPAGDWNPNLGVDPDQVTQFDTRPYNLYSQNPYNSSCATLVSAYNALYRLRRAFCPAAYGFYAQYVPPLTLSSVQTCHNPYMGYVIGPILECPAGNSASTEVGDPCDVATGDLSQTEPDYSRSDLFFGRYYHSANLESHHGLGVGWTHNYAAYLVLTGGVPTGLLRPDGHHDAVQNINGEYVSLSGAAIHVQQSGSNWIATLSDGRSEVYDNSGRLIQLVAYNGQITTLAYTASAQLQSVTDPFGHSLQFGYNTNGQLQQFTDPSGNVTSYAYDGNNNLISVTYPDGSRRQYVYENSSFPHNLTGIVDEANNRFLTVQYDSTTGAAVSSQQAGGAEAVSISYTATGALVTDALGATSAYVFTNDPNFAPRTTSLQRNNVTRSFAVPAGSDDPQRRVTQSTDANGNITQFTYDADHLVSKTEAVGTTAQRTTSYQYLSANSALPILVIQALVQTQYTYYNGTNLVQRKTVTDPATQASRSWRYTYDSYGRTLTIQGPRTDLISTTAYTYYTCSIGAQCGQIQTVTDAAGNVTTYNSYNAHGQPLRITDPNGIVTTLTYDTRLRLTSRQIGSETATFAYWPTGLLKQVTLPDGSYLLYSYDAAHRLTQISDPLGNSVDYTLDAMGNRIAENTYSASNVLHNTHTRIFNTLNQLSQDVNAANTAAVTTTYGYDNNGNQTSVNAPLSRNTSKLFDALNRVARITDAANGISSFAYDANNKTVSVTDPRMLTTAYTYNGFGDLLQQVSPDSGTTLNTYDSGGNLATSTDARGAVSTYTYDALNRVTAVAYALGGTTDQTIAFTYDAGPNGKGHLTGVADANHTLRWGYDTLGRVISKSQTVGGITRTIGYTYVNGNLTSIVTPSGQTIAYGYDSDHQVTSITVNGTPLLTNVSYEPLGAVNGWTWGNGAAVTRSYDQDGNIAQIASGGETYQYTLDNGQRITGIANSVDNNLSWSYGYDSLDRLISASSLLDSETYSYTPNGTRLSWNGTVFGQSFSGTYGVDSGSNRITSVSLTGGNPQSTAVQYDAAGHVVSEWSATATYNAAGRPVALTGAAAGQYIYNALSQRIAKVTPSGTVLFAYDESGHLLGEYDGTGALVEETVWLGDVPVATLQPDANGNVAIYYIHTDHLNTPRKVSRPSDNQLVWRWDVDPFADQQPDGNPQGLGQFTYNLRYPGQYFDAESGYHYNRYRYYDPISGTYTQSDPSGLQGGIDTYEYANGDPVRLIDPSGLSAKDVKAIVDHIRQNFPEIHPGGWEFGNPGPENLAQAGFWGTIIVDNRFKAPCLSYDDFFSLYFSTLHESMHSTDPVDVRAWDNMYEFYTQGGLTQNHKNIRNRESYEEGFSPNGVPKPMWGENGEVRSPPIWPQVKALYDATRPCECRNQ